jgi:rhamnose utilization protein RhaD (predicted bifunctional aldolase and dehydrogenase)
MSAANAIIGLSYCNTVRWKLLVQNARLRSWKSKFPLSESAVPVDGSCRAMGEAPVGVAAIRASERALHRAIATVSQSDPIIKLLQQVQLGRMKPTDAGLRAVVESWLATYLKVVETAGLNKQALRRIDPTPRVTLLVEKGVLPQDHQAVAALQAGFQQAMINAMD